MVRKKGKGTELSVFKGREAKLNRAIFKTLIMKSPQTIYDITKTIKNQRGLGHTKYTNVSRRVRALEQSGFVDKAGVKETQAGTQAILYQLATRTHVAILLDHISPDALIVEADQDALNTMLAALVLFLQSPIRH